MKMRSENHGGVSLANCKVVLSVILLSGITGALTSRGEFESTAIGAGIQETVPSAATKTDMAERPAANEPGEDGSGQVASWRTLQMRVTAYCPCRRCCGRHSDGITASGHEIERGNAFVAAGKAHAFGTEMIVPGYNDSQPVKVLDRGGAIRGNRLDIFFDSHQKAKTWGVKYLQVKVRTS